MGGYTERHRSEDYARFDPLVPCFPYFEGIEYTPTQAEHDQGNLLISWHSTLQTQPMLR